MVSKIKSYIEESRQELKKVNWPSRQETIYLTTIVVLMSLFVAAFLGFIDIIFRYIITEILVK